jgi:S-adenosylmethionine synthetase
MHRKNYIFTSESVGEGHPDKVCDQISDAVLDAALAQDPNSRVACETFTTTGLVLIGGEITTDTYIDFKKVAKEVLIDLGYTRWRIRDRCPLLRHHEQYQRTKSRISVKVSPKVRDYTRNKGAGDQGIMFGYANTDTPELMPAPDPIQPLYHEASLQARRNKTIPYLRPDGKGQVSVEYKDGKPSRIHTVVLSHQHDAVFGR